MNRLTLSVVGALALASFTTAACTNNNGTSTTPVTTPTTPSAPAPVATKPALATPAAVTPLSGSTAATRPTLTVLNAGRTGTFTGSVTYTFDLAQSVNFSSITLSGTASEGSGQTSFVVPTDLVSGRTYYWRATAVDSADGITSNASDVQSFTIAPVTTAEKIAAQQGVVLWTGVVPTGTAGQARLGPGWGVGLQTSYDGVTYLSPPTEVLRVFDLIDRGMDPDSAIRWMRSNGYPSVAVYYDSVKSIGFPAQYMALIGGAWELVHRVGA